MFLVNTSSEETYSQVKCTYHITDCPLAAIYQKKISRINYCSQCLECSGIVLKYMYELMFHFKKLFFTEMVEDFLNALSDRVKPM